jgi:hypothetical protein
MECQVVILLLCFISFLYSYVFILRAVHCLPLMHFPPYVHFPTRFAPTLRCLDFLLSLCTFHLLRIFPQNVIQHAQTVFKTTFPTLLVSRHAPLSTL